MNQSESNHIHVPTPAHGHSSVHPLQPALDLAEALDELTETAEN